MNITTISGRIGKDLEASETSSGVKKLPFSVAVSDYNGKEKVTVWYNTIARGKTAEMILKYFKKGDPIEIRGRLFNNNYEKNGVKHHGMTLNVDQIYFPAIVSSGNTEPVAETATTNQQNSGEMLF